MENTNLPSTKNELIIFILALALFALAYLEMKACYGG